MPHKNGQVKFACFYKTPKVACGQSSHKKWRVHSLGKYYSEWEDNKSSIVSYKAQINICLAIWLWDLQNRFNQPVCSDILNPMCQVDQVLLSGSLEDGGLRLRSQILSLSFFRGFCDEHFEFLTNLAALPSLFQSMFVWWRSLYTSQRKNLWIDMSHSPLYNFHFPLCLCWEMEAVK